MWIYVGIRPESESWSKQRYIFFENLQEKLLINILKVICYSISRRMDFKNYN